MTDRVKNGSMGFLALIIAPFVIFNPDLAIVDVLPDLIGYFLIAFGITSLSYICPQIEAARPRFFVAGVVELAKLVAMFLIFGLANQNERPVMILLAVFAFAVVELIVLVPAWNGLFDGLLYLGTRTGAMAPYASHRGRVTITGYAKAVTGVFLFFKPLCAVLPEFASLTSGGFDETKFDWYEFIGLFREFGIMLSAIMGIFWLIVIERYFIRLKRDGEYIAALRAKYESEILPGDIRFVKRRIKTAFVLLAAAFFFEIDFMLEYNNVIPDVLAALCFAAFFAVLGGELYRRRNIALPISIAYVLSAGIGDWLGYDFNNRYFNALVWQSSEVRSAFFVRYTFVILSAVLFVAVTCFAADALRQIVRDHAGFIAENTDRAFVEAKLLEIRRYLYRFINAVVIMAAVCAISFCIGDVIITLNSSIYESMGVISGTMRTLSSVWWIISSALCFVNFLILLKTNSEIDAEIESRYMLK